ncbi:MAG: IS200/IS605 family accessory protein TnpB-related protein, partial [Nitrososphaerales archaeon]
MEVDTSVQTLKVLESVKQNFSPNEKQFSMMDTFRRMLNDCIRIGLDQNKTSFLQLRYACYPKLKNYDIASAYKNNAISRASGILSNYRRLLKKGKKVSVPYCWKPMLTTCRGFVLRLEGNDLILPSKLKIKLNDYILKKLHGTEIRSVTAGTRTVSVCFSKKIRKIECTGILGIDTNLENVTVADSYARIKKHDVTKISEKKAKYREVKRHFRRNDARIQKEICSKYGRLQTDKAQVEIHKITSRIVKQAKKQNFGIALENIKGIRKLYRKGNGQGKGYRFRLNSWTFGMFQRQIEYKAKREGLP